MDDNNQTKYEFYGVPQSLTIGIYKYSYKVNTKDENSFIYRCVHRNCKAQITIDKDNILKALMKKENSSIIYQEGKNPHSCQKPEVEKKKEINNNMILTSNEINDLGCKLIKQHIDKPLSFHLDNLKKNNIPFSKNKIKYYLQKYREESFPEDKYYLDNIELIKITYDNNKDEFKDLPFCYVNSKFLNPEKKNRREMIIIFSSEIQLKKLEKAKQIFMDATFKSCPKNFYQLFNILVDIDQGKIVFPVAHILMTHKSSYSYKIIFEYLNNLIKSMEINFTFDKAHIMTDFEHSLRKVISEMYPNCYLEGCYFHYSKSLWNKAKKLGLINKKYLQTTKVIIFAYKMYHFLKN